MRILLCLPLAMVALAGCLGTDTAASASQPGDDPQPAPWSSQVPWSLTAGYGIVVADGSVPLTGDRYTEVDATKGAHISVTSTWECPTGPACRMGLAVYDADGHTVAVDEGTSPLTADAASDGRPITITMWALRGGSVVVDAQGVFDVQVTP